MPPPPPGSKDGIQRAFGPELEPLGLRLTRAGRVAQPGARGYVPDGRHLAVYVEPKGPTDMDGYAVNVERVAKVFLPEVFDRLPGVDSFDVCQEPPPGVDDREEPRTLTQLLITRAQAAPIDWEKVRLTDMVISASRYPSGLTLAVAPEVQSSSAWLAAVAEVQAGARPGTG